MSRDFFPFLLRLVELLRPRFYNRLTWLMVFGGIAMMSTRLWELVIEVLFERQFNISIVGSNDAAWGFSLCVLGLVYHTINTGLYESLRQKPVEERKQREWLHDTDLFKRANDLLSEQQLLSFIRLLEDDHSYYLDEANAVDRFSNFLAETGNGFLSPALAAKATEFNSAWRALSQFITYKFYVFPKNQTEPNPRLCMTPGLNVDREGDGTHEQGRKYDALSQELGVLTEKVSCAYLGLRATVKHELVI